MAKSTKDGSKPAEGDLANSMRVYNARPPHKSAYVIVDEGLRSAADDRRDHGED